MQIIPTTASAVEKIKSSAKSIKQAEKISHMKALERAAKDAGYDSWYHVGHCLDQKEYSSMYDKLNSIYIRNTSEAKMRKYMALLSDKGSDASVSTNPNKGSVFRDVVIDGMRFKGVVGVNGPSLMNVPPLLHEERIMKLGTAEIHYVPSLKGGRDAWLNGGTDAGWWICHDSPSEPRINIDSLTEEGRHLLAFEFGIPLYPRLSEHPETIPEGGEQLLLTGKVLFFLSPSFKYLCKWAQNHPRQVRSSKFGEQYLRGWKNAAIKGEYVPNWLGWEGIVIKAE